MKRTIWNVAYNGSIKTEGKSAKIIAEFQLGITSVVHIELRVRRRESIEYVWVLVT